MKREITGARHNAELKPGCYYVGSIVALEMGYNRNPPAKWENGLKVLYGR